jgi:hypothetical protein
MKKKNKITYILFGIPSCVLGIGGGLFINGCSKVPNNYKKIDDKYLDIYGGIWYGFNVIFNNSFGNFVSLPDDVKVFQYLDTYINQTWSSNIKKLDLNKCTRISFDTDRSSTFKFRFLESLNIGDLSFNGFLSYSFFGLMYLKEIIVPDSNEDYSLINSKKENVTKVEVDGFLIRKTDFDQGNTELHPVCSYEGYERKFGIAMGNINIPDNFVSLANRTFNACYAISSVSLNNVRAIGNNVFCDDLNLKTIYLDASVPNVEESELGYTFGEN